MEGTFQMTERELNRIEVITELISGKLTVSEAGEKLSLSRRQIFRIKTRVSTEGKCGVAHRLRNRVSNRGYSSELKNKVMEIYKKQYEGYGPTLFSEELLSDYGIEIGRETIRRWMREKYISSSSRKKRPHRRRRERRSAYGELLQFDGSQHYWFEDRGAESCLYVIIDDATGKIHLRLGRTENTADAMYAIWGYMKENGIPRSIYTDRFSVYYAKGKLTDFGRAMRELGIEIIYANSPQAKGRVERCNRTLQDRLVKALRKRGISTIAEANEYFNYEFISQYNKRFGINGESPDVHRSLEGYDLRDILCYKTTRQVRNDYTINLDGGYVQLLQGESPMPRPRQDVMLVKRLNGEMLIYYNGQEIKYEVQKGKKAKQNYKMRRLPKDHPWRRMNNRMPGSTKQIEITTV